MFFHGIQIVEFLVAEIAWHRRAEDGIVFSFQMIIECFWFLSHNDDKDHGVW